MNLHGPFGSRAVLETAKGPVTIYRLERLASEGLTQIQRLPFTIRVLLENMLRHHDGSLATADDVEAVAGWRGNRIAQREIPFMPGRVVLQDFTGVPAVVDLAAMRSALARMGGDPGRINPKVPVDLVIDHSVQVDTFGTAYAFLFNVEREFERNRERYMLLRWAQEAFDNFRVVPPGTGIVHQVNLEYLGSVVACREGEDGTVAYPDTLVGTDSHTTMINSLGTLGWGVGGIEAEAVMLGQPYYMLIPEVVGFKLRGALPEGATATDLVLTVTQILRQHGVVGRFVEFFGSGLSRLSLPDRATIANMAPEYGATCGFFPVDHETLQYLRGTGRDPQQVDLVERYAREQHLFRTDSTADPEYTDVLEFDLSTVEPSLAGPKRPQDRATLDQVRNTYFEVLKEYDRPVPDAGGAAARGKRSRSMAREGRQQPQRQEAGSRSRVALQERPTRQLADGAVVIAAITSCTNTSNPSVMVAAGLVAKNAVERGCTVPGYVKTSMAPGSRVVEDYLKRAGLLSYLEALRFHIVGFGCTTCIGNSGQLPEEIARQVQDEELVVASVLSGNRNFEGRIHAQIKANYLASPPLVVAYALAGRIDVNLLQDPLGHDPNGQPVYLADIWPSQEEIRATLDGALHPSMFRERYADVFTGDERWRQLPVPDGEEYAWQHDSSYVQEPPFFFDLPQEPPAPSELTEARVLALLGDSITTDHISPAGAIPQDGPAGQYLVEQGVEPSDFNTYGARRGNHEVMMRGTFANIRLRNRLAPGRQGGWTTHLPTGEELSIFAAAMRYQEEGTPLIVLAGSEYGTGSSRDWAAKGTLLLGVDAVIATSYERIHRNNLVGMGVLPLQFKDGENAETLGLDGSEVYDIEGIAGGLEPGKEVTVTARRDDGAETSFHAIVRLDTPVDAAYYTHGGILQKVLRDLRLRD